MKPRLVHVPITTCVAGDVLVTFPAGTAVTVGADGTVIELYGFPERRRFTVLDVQPDAVTVVKPDGTEATYTGETLLAWVYKEEQRTIN